MRNPIENIPRLLLLAEHLKTKDINQAHALQILAYSNDRYSLFIGVNGKCYPLFPVVIQELPNLFDE
ncbi:MAG: hypothetical protein A3F72_17750 [Bacteroidetes bacterium RIFCSPLOWO2_12_FULL_35_15]|nr:MAG: hypothetical protein A3F72_17750 [Bacteroidetes bacterium RIFCSPLOWO2_12_FULL_35_15]